MKTVLFLCTGNYYRSRFAELLFNALDTPGWQAESRGLATEWGFDNIGPMSRKALDWLTHHGLAAPEPLRDPLQAQAEDLARADLVIAVNEAEHRPLVQARFPEWAERVRYWHILDLGEAPAYQALPALAREVEALSQRLMPSAAPAPAASAPATETPAR